MRRSIRLTAIMLATSLSLAPAARGQILYDRSTDNADPVRCFDMSGAMRATPFEPIRSLPGGIR